jgi:hypothetical protein
MSAPEHTTARGRGTHHSSSYRARKGDESQEPVRARNQTGPHREMKRAGPEDNHTRRIKGHILAQIII